MYKEYDEQQNPEILERNGKFYFILKTGSGLPIFCGEGDTKDDCLSQCSDFKDVNPNFLRWR